MHNNVPFVNKKLQNCLGRGYMPLPTAGLMFISLLGPQLRDFDPRPYVLKWLSSGNRARLPTISHASVHLKRTTNNIATNIWHTYFSLIVFNTIRQHYFVFNFFNYVHH